MYLLVDLVKDMHGCDVERALDLCLEFTVDPEQVLDPCGERPEAAYEDAVGDWHFDWNGDGEFRKAGG